MSALPTSLPLRDAAPSSFQNGRRGPKTQAHAPARARSLLAAVSEDDFRLFFPDGFPAPAACPLLRVFPEDRRADFSGLRGAAPEVVVTSWSSPFLSEELLGKDGALASVRYVCHLAGSVRPIVPRSFIERGGLVTNWGTLPSETVAEHALLLVLASLRNLPRWKRLFEPGVAWGLAEMETATLFRRRVGLHGAGGVARTLAALLRPFGAEVEAYSEGAPDDLYERAALRKAPSLADLFSRNEIVVECEALTPATRGSVSRAVLERMPPGALFVNVGRAAVADEAALAELAAQGRLRLALDVYLNEPPEPDSLLRRLPDAVLSPHVAGPTSDLMADIGLRAAANIGRYLEGRPLDAPVSLDIYDRST